MRAMDFQSFLAGEEEKVSRGSRHVKDFSVFHFDYVPDEPLMREEAKLLIRHMLQFKAGGIPTHHAIIGTRGSGKTLTVKFLKRRIPRHTKLDVAYVNCRHHNTSFKILAHLLGLQARGNSLSELFSRFEASRSVKTVVVLDEIDLMSPKDKRREILYLLSRSAHPFMVVMLSNSPEVLKELDPATRSSLQPQPLHFRNYNAEQIGDILRDRARRGLHRWDEGTLTQIAALTTKLTNADARVAIKTLYHVVTEASEDIEQCFNRARRDVMVDMIMDLSDATLAVLWSVASSHSAFAREVYGRYCRFCAQQHEKAFSYVHFCSSLSYLQSVGLVGLVYTKVGRTYTNRVMLTFDQPVLQHICRMRFGL